MSSDEMVLFTPFLDDMMAALYSTHFIFSL